MVQVGSNKAASFPISCAQTDCSSEEILVDIVVEQTNFQVKTNSVYVFDTHVVRYSI